MERIILFTGAGTSAESGIPTFRTDDKGNIALWNKVNPNTVCNMRTFRGNRDVVCSFYNEFRTMVGKTEPNTFHHEVKKWQVDLEKRGVKLIVITQNVDHLFEKAGIENVYHIHGDIRYMQCLAFNHTWNVGFEEQKVDTMCDVCTCKVCKPGVVFFNEQAPLYPLTYKMLASLNEKDALIIVGSSCSVFPIWEFLGKNAYKIYSALEMSKYVEQEKFDVVILDKCSTAISKIREMTEKKMKEYEDNPPKATVRKKKSGKYPQYW